ncbi:hypothetical protein PYW07_003480 [Mythimna separata]|uniref:Cilia- and flagella-associated protein 157 n=1 Tax=Mythimna separata TaxID=271217 RepID=A0AAD7YI01_MYTSE|nr:hypothetical protein PYW07_003480 [Mythimna separata]
MAPKKSKTVIVFSEVEKAFYELQLADCNKKLARLRTVVDDHEVRYEELQKAYDQLDEDRGDVISYLKKTLSAKTEENDELKENLKNLQELRVEETTKFHETVTELEYNFTRMKDQLTSENKLLAGKLNALEEFRAIKEDLMRKYEQQERAIADQEMKYKRMLYDDQKKFIIGKDKLKKEMEEKLVELAQHFQDGSELRIAASTHRVIRENIALGNQLDNLLVTQAKLSEQNDKFREYVRDSRCAKEVAEEERDKAINKSIVQLKVIDQLTAAFENVKKQKELHVKKQLDIEKVQTKMNNLKKENKSLLLQVQILEQNLHAALGEQNKSVVETAKLIREHKTFKNILKESECAVEAALKMDQWSTLDPSREIMDREIVLKKILGVISQYRKATRAESTESLVSLSKIYEKGDLGFEVKPVPSRKSQIKETALPTTASLQSFEDKRSDKRSGILTSSVSTSEESIKTIPSIEVLPVAEESLSTPVDSLPSFTVLSLHSSRSSTSDSTQSLKSMSKLLAHSKVEMQKSLMADLAILSSISQRRMTIGPSNTKFETMTQKSVTISEKKESIASIKDEQHKTISEEDQTERTEDTGATSDSTAEGADKLTEKADETIHGTDESTQETKTGTE